MTSEKENLDQRHREEHESFGIISFTRGNGANMALFGSSILHQHIIRMEIRSATRIDTLTRTGYMATKFY